MFSHQYGELEGSAVHFYGNDGVCLFKYFVRSDDARRSRQTLDGVADISDDKGDLIVWVMLGINLACFVLITVCYVLLNIKVRKSAQKSGTDNSPKRKRENKDIQNRITLIVVTDFLCWIPFIIISGLHNLKVFDATRWYASFAMIVLPLNSVINPLLYDNKLREAAVAKIRSPVTSRISFITER
jgi:heme/copper-type cytochrome/quinol oxidase subunit 2